MSGNVEEWTADWYDINYYSNSPANNPQGPATGTEKITRGGSFMSSYGYDVYSRPIMPVPLETRYNSLGFRCVR